MAAHPRSSGGILRRDDPARYDIGALEARVTVLSEEIHNVRQSITSLHAKFDQGRATPWGAVTAGLAALGLIGAVVVWAFGAYTTQINSNQQAMMGSIEKLANVVVPRAELEDRRAISNQRIDRMDRDIEKLEMAQVSRGEMQEHWRAQETGDLQIQKQIDDIRATFGSSYSLKDALSEIQARIERLERIRLTGAMERVPVAPYTNGTTQ